MKSFRNEALRYLGYSGQTINEELTRRLDKWALACENEFSPTYTCRAFAIDEERTSWEGEPAVALQGCNLLLEGNSIAPPTCAGRTSPPASPQRWAWQASVRCIRWKPPTRLMPSYTMLAAMRLSKQLRKPHRKTLLPKPRRRACSPACASAPATATCLWPCSRASSKAPDAQKLAGLSVNSSLLLVPAKSVTAVVGLFSTVPQTPARTPCQDCIAREYCSYLEKGITCYGNHH